MRGRGGIRRAPAPAACSVSGPPLPLVPGSRRSARRSPDCRRRLTRPVQRGDPAPAGRAAAPRRTPSPPPPPDSASTCSRAGMRARAEAAFTGSGLSVATPSDSSSTCRSAARDRAIWAAAVRSASSRSVVPPPRRSQSRSTTTSTRGSADSGRSTTAVDQNATTPSSSPGRIRCTSADGGEHGGGQFVPGHRARRVDQQHGGPPGRPPAAGVQVLGPPVRLGARGRRGWRRGRRPTRWAPAGSPPGWSPAGRGCRVRGVPSGSRAASARAAARSPGSNARAAAASTRAAASGSRAARSATAAASSSPACGETASKSGLLRESWSRLLRRARLRAEQLLDRLRILDDPRWPAAPGRRAGPGGGGPGDSSPGVRLFPAPHRPGARCRRRRPRPVGPRRRRG